MNECAACVSVFVGSYLATNKCHVTTICVCVCVCTCACAWMAGCVWVHACVGIILRVCMSAIHPVCVLLISVYKHVHVCVRLYTSNIPGPWTDS